MRITHWIFIAMMMSTLLGPAATGDTAPRQFVTTKGKQFIAPNGEPLFLKGIGLGNWLLPEGYMFKFKRTNSPRRIETVINELVGEDEARNFWRTFRANYITSDDIRFLKQAGFNSVRIPFNYRLLATETDPPALEGPGYELLDRVIGWCKEQQLYVVLDMHGAPGGQSGDNIDDSSGYPFLFESPASQELTVRLWKKLADRYKDEPIVIGYDLLNEPIAHFFDIEKLNPKLEPLYKRIVAAIREVDKQHIIFLGGAQWNTNFRIFGAPFDDKLAYTFHKYWMDPVVGAIQDFLDFSGKYNVPLWMGESGENTDDWIAKYRVLLEEKDVSWCFWPYKKLDSTRGVLSIRRPEDWDAIIAFAEHPRLTFEEIRNNRPPRDTITKAMSDFLENSKFKNCQVNAGYLKALGLTAP